MLICAECYKGQQLALGAQAEIRRRSAYLAAPRRVLHQESWPRSELKRCLAVSPTSHPGAFAIGPSGGPTARKGTYPREPPRVELTHLLQLKLTTRHHVTNRGCDTARRAAR
jgi:hypothetical protein